MDLIRASIKCLFNDYPLETAIDAICGKINSVKDFLKPFPFVVQVRERNYTLTEMDTLQDMLLKVWMKDNGKHVLTRPFELLKKFSDDVLTINAHNDPIVKFPNYLRWHDLTHYIGEDLLTCFFLAQNDNEIRDNYAWPATLEHDNQELNDILAEGVSDVHHHLQASTNVFSINWITLMNTIPDFNLNDEEEEGHQIDFESKDILEYPMKDKSFIYWKHGRQISFYNLTVVASLIRLFLFRIIMGESIPEKDWQLLDNIILSQQDLKDSKEDIRGKINTSAHERAKECYGVKYWDYAIQDVLNYGNLDSPYILLAGERWLLYNFALLYKDNDTKVDRIAPYVYLYCLIKSKFRSEFIFNNEMKGYRNFKLYHNSMNKFYKNISTRKDAAILYALRAGLRNTNQDFLETRIACDYDGSLQRLLDKQRPDDGIIYQELMKHISFVASTSKMFMNCDKDSSQVQKGEDVRRYAKTRKSAKDTAEEVAKSFSSRSSEFKQSPTTLIGMDAAGDEANARPEAFATAFRYLKSMNINNLTFHAGEDFFDILDGLRTIDELLLFMDYSKGNRIGHALALGLSAEHFYQSRHFTILAPQQVILDNFVWLLQRCKNYYHVQIPEVFNGFIESECQKLFSDIYHEDNFNVDTYWESMLLRANDNREYREDAEPSQYGYYAKFKECENKDAERLFYLYFLDYDVRNRGNIPFQVKYEEDIIKLIEIIQLSIRKELHDRGIAIECAPTSNMLIGPLYRYDDHPMLNMCKINGDENDLSVSINTDDAGIFCTSLYAEYSLMALALIKQGNNNNSVYDYIRRLKNNGNEQRFTHS